MDGASAADECPVVAETSDQSKLLRIFQYETNECSEECLVALAHGERLTFYGSVTVKPLYGLLFCFGHKHTSRSPCRMRVCAPFSMGAAASLAAGRHSRPLDRAKFTAAMLHHCVPESVVDELVSFAGECAAESRCCTVFSLRPDPLPWITAVQQIYTNAFLLPPTFSLGTEPACGEPQKLCRTAVHVSAGAGVRLCAELSACLEDISGELLSAADGLMVVAVLGAQNAGKSTACRALVNYALSKRRAAGRNRQSCRVHVFDCDVGQSEFAPGCSVSLCSDVGDALLLGPPPAHMNVGLAGGGDGRSALHSLYFGYNTPGANVDRYLRCVRSLFHVASKAHLAKGRNLLVVNTCGWVTGAGADLTSKVLSTLNVTHVLQLESHTPFFIELPPTATKRWNVKRRLGRRLQPGALSGRDQRDVSTISYFSAMCQGGHLRHLQAATPFAVDFGDIAVWWPDDVPARCIAMAANARLCALCVHTEDGESLARYNGESTLPHRLPPACELACVGYGFVRAVCTARRRFYLITPLDGNAMAKVNTMAFGQMTMPAKVLSEQPRVHSAPYMRRPLAAAASTSQQRMFAVLNAPLQGTTDAARRAHRQRQLAAASKGAARLPLRPAAVALQPSGGVRAARLLRRKSLKRLGQAAKRKPIAWSLAQPKGNHAKKRNVKRNPHNNARPVRRAASKIKCRPPGGTGATIPVP